MTDDLRNRIKAALLDNIEPAAPGLGERIGVTLAAAPLAAPWFTALLAKVAGLIRHWLTIVGVGGVAVIAAIVVITSRPPDVAVYVAYADGRPPAAGQPGPTFPNPWMGASKVSFRGTGPPFDAGALRIDNDSSGQVRVDRVSVDIGASHFELWGANLKIDPGGTLILTQTQILSKTPIQTNFDTSEAKGTSCLPSPQAAVIHVTVNGHQFQFRDTKQVLTTGGGDRGNCPGAPNESHQWERLPSS